MKRIFYFMMLMSIALVSCKNNVNDAPKPSWFPTSEAEYDNQIAIFEQFPINSTDIVFAGGSSIADCDWSECIGNPAVKNRAIAKERADGLIYRAASIAKGKPQKIFFQIGYDDLFLSTEPKDVFKSVKEFCNIVNTVSPDTELYFISLVKYKGSNRYFTAIDELNSLVKNDLKNCTYIDIESSLVNENGILDEKYYDSDMVMNRLGYLVAASVIAPQTGLSPVVVNESSKIVMYGGDIMHDIDWTEVIPMANIIDRTQKGDDILKIMNKMTEFVGTSPSKMFVMPSKGEVSGMEVNELWNNYKTFINFFNKSFPDTQLYILAQLPFGTAYQKYDSAFNNKLVEVNKLMEAAQSKYNFLFLDPATVLADENGNLKSELTFDGEKLNPDGIFTFATMLLQGPRMLTFNPNNL